MATYDIDNAKSYKTEANLMAALERLGFTNTEHSFFVVCNRSGRFTAIFQWNRHVGGYAGIFAQAGFLTI